MSTSEIYTVTPIGANELRGGATRLPAALVQALVRLDGILSLEQLTRRMTPPEVNAFKSALRELIKRRLVEPVEMDPFTSAWHASMVDFSTSEGSESVDSGMASLQRSGFFVEIAHERATRRRPDDEQPRTVVVVEDDLHLRSFTRTLLRLSGFTVRQASNRAEVVNEIRRPPRPDLVLLDVVLPDTDGFEILMRMRQHPVLKDVPVIMLTAKATREAVLKGITLGADGYLTKPFEPDVLVRAVRTVLGLPQEPAMDGGKPPGSGP